MSKVEGFLRFVCFWFYFSFMILLMLAEFLARPLLKTLFKMKVVGEKYIGIYKLLLQISSAGLLEILGVKVVIMAPVLKF